MEKYLQTGIKEIITEFPPVGAILEEYGIGCGPCTVGMCRLEDILDIHTLAPPQEKELMARIEGAIYPDRHIEILQSPTETQTSPVPISYSPPMQRLVDEHILIKRWLALIPAVTKHLDLASPDGTEMIEQGIDLIRSYADRLHHAKEEDILFHYFDDTSEIFQVIYADHRRGRDLVSEMVSSLQKKDAGPLASHLLAYGELLSEHIKKEDEILFPWIDRQLDADLRSELHEKFTEEDRHLGIDEQRYLAFVTGLEQKFGMHR